MAYLLQITITVAINKQPTLSVDCLHNNGVI